MTSLLKKLSLTWKRFWGDSRGAVLFYVTATLPAIVGFALLAIDASRLGSLHTSLQKGVDAFAIAGAGELDRTSDSIARARLAVRELVNNRQIFGDGNAAFTEGEVVLRFLTAIPDNDWEPIDPATVIAVADESTAAANSTARFVEVTANPFPMNAIFPASFLGTGASNSATARATAIAGNDQVVCNTPPVFICNPYELPGNTDKKRVVELKDALLDPVMRRRLIALRQGPGNGGEADWFPGNFGFLDAGNGARDLAEAIAAVDPGSCIVTEGVDTEPGQMEGPITTAFNTRFGLYDNPFFAGQNALDEYPPSVNVRKGQTPHTGGGQDTTCSSYNPEDDHAQGQSLPHPSCYDDPTPNGGCSYRVEPENVALRENWDDAVDDYWVNNGFGVPDVNGDVDRPAFQTRYEIYNWEIDNPDNLVVHPLDVAAPNGETGRVGACYTGGGTAHRHRRLMGLAILNCYALSPLNGAEDEVIVAGFGEFFMTEPLSDETGRNVFIELVNFVEQGNGIVVNNYDQVQLYR